MRQKLAGEEQQELQKHKGSRNGVGDTRKMSEKRVREGSA